MAVKMHQTIRVRRKKYGAGTDYIQCNMCHGTGRVKNGHKKKRKA